MKNLTIKSKITLWYTVFMILLVGLFLFFLLIAGTARSLTLSHNRLKKTVMKSSREISVRDHSLYFDEDFVLSGLEEGIYLSAYDARGNYLHGHLPAYYNGPSALLADTIQQEYDFHTQWYIYDSCITLENYGTLWIRGMHTPSHAEKLLPVLLRLSLILFPFLVIFIAFGGYWITRRSLAPLTSMTDTALSIAGGQDLSRRISLNHKHNEVHQLADTFDQMMDRLQTAFENEKQFTSDVSHELRTPLSVILAQCEFALSQPVSAEESRQAFHSIMTQAGKMNTLISQLLTLARAESGSQILHPEHLDLSLLAQVIIEEQQLAAAGKNITIQSRLPERLMIHADETLMMRLLINLISNSITYGKPDGHVALTLREAEGMVYGEVTDDGIGISSEHLDKIWNRFYQADPSRKHSEKGSAGLGLPMVKWILRAHKGDITVSSTPMEGSTFSFHFPTDPFPEYP